MEMALIYSLVGLILFKCGYIIYLSYRLAKQVKETKQWRRMYLNLRKEIERTK